MAFPLLFLKVRGFLSGGNSFRSPRIVDTDRHRDLREREFLSLMRFNGIFAARFRTHERERHVRTVLESQFCPSNKYAFGCLRIPYLYDRKWLFIYLLGFFIYLFFGWSDVYPFIIVVFYKRNEIVIFHICEEYLPYIIKNGKIGSFEVVFVIYDCIVATTRHVCILNG